jgi:hypothetical protein
MKVTHVSQTVRPHVFDVPQETTGAVGGILIPKSRFACSEVIFKQEVQGTYCEHLSWLPICYTRRDFDIRI